jgi:hypothetical protein
VRILTLWQPWASLVGRGKTHETRSWKTDYRGPILIHAAARWDRDLLAKCLEHPFSTALAASGMLFGSDEDGWDVRMPRGAVVSVAELVRCLPTDIHGILGEKGDGKLYRISNLDYAFGNWSPGRWAWRFDKVVHLERPVPWKGGQGLRNAPEELVEEVMKVLPSPLEGLE